MPALVVTSGSLQGTRIDVAGEVTIGRENQDFIVPDPEVSRSHAVLRIAGGRLVIEDRGSSNGTWVNGRRISRATPLLEGDEVVLGQTYFRAEPGRGEGTAVAGPRVGGTAVAPANVPGPQQPPVPGPPPGGPPLHGGVPPDPSHTAPMQTFSYEERPQEPVEGPGRRVGPLVGIVIGGLVVIGAIVLLALFFLNRPPSKEEFIEEADAICAANSDEADALEQPSDAPLEELAPYFEEIRKIQEDEVQELEALEAPDEDADLLDDFLGTQRELATNFATMSESASSGDQDGFDSALVDATTVQSRATELAQDYGFENCGKSTPGGE